MLARMSRLILATLALALSPTLVEGAIIFDNTPGGGNPDENLLFNDGNLQLGPGATIQGVTNNSNRVLDITSNTATNLVGNGGQARVDGEAGVAFGSVTLTPHTANNLPGGLLPMGSFTDLKFNIDATTDGTVNFTVVTNLDTYTYNNEDLDNTGQNFFRFTTSGGEVITSVTIAPSGSIITNLQQIRLGGVVGPTTTTTTATTTNTTTVTPTLTPTVTPTAGGAVPEPLTLALWGGLGGGMMLFNRRRKASA